MSSQPHASAPDPAAGLLKMSELAERSGVSPGTIRHYLREGLLGDGRDIVRTSRNMAYYPPELVDRIKLIKLLQEERFMPLRVIRELLEREQGDPERVRDRLEAADRGLEVALARERERQPAAEVGERYSVPADVLARLAEIGVLSPPEQGYSLSDVRIVEAISRFRAGGYDERIGFTAEWVDVRAARQIDRLRELDVRVVGDLEDLRPVPLTGVDPSTCPPEDALAAAVDSLAYLVSVWPSP